MFHFLRKNNYSIRLLQIFFLLISIAGLYISPLSWIIIGLVMYVLLETFAGNIGLHRYFGHKSFKTNKFWHNLFVVISHYIGVGSVVSWVGQHRHHHKWSDTEKDVHSYKHLGIMKILFGVWEVKIERHLIKDVLKDKTLMWWHKHYWKFHIFLILFYCFLDYYFHTWLLFAFYALPNLMCLMSGYVLAIVTHSHGYKTYSINGLDRATNSWLANIYTLGEGWHNNHHAFPNRLRQGEKWWEWDLPAFIIEKLIQK